MAKPKFTFTMDLQPAAVPHLLYGKLKFDDGCGKGVVFEATSGQPRHQYPKAWLTPRKGCLPPTQVIKQLYTVNTQALFMPNTQGVGGDFFAIAPFSVDLGAVNRGDFGIHLDSNYPQSPGSAGCIVIRNKQHFQQVRDLMKRLNSQRIKSVDLEVIYV
jgi:hypothetical protein